MYSIMTIGGLFNGQILRKVGDMPHFNDNVRDKVHNMRDMAKIDRRVLKTKKAIRNAFAKLLSTKEVNQITVTDIADAADINRKTFYSYYSGAYAVMEEIENEILSSFATAIEDLDLTQALQDPYEVFIRLTAVISRDLEFYSHLMQTNSSNSLTMKLVTMLKQRFKATFGAHLNVDEKALDMLLDYTLAGMLKVYQEWFNSERTESIEEMSKKLSILTFAGTNGFLESQSKE